ncbi:hypothetical protein QZH56_31745 [Streptomyces olivoreticuli]|uniref:Guanylate cyclase domain-containing protein n=1 Tax=Streptomyces blastmyceticus TaxID=68180 RepID=A0ABN0X697_9ACTN|nr:hypothetical protein [Streptomyces olivoreticuli]WKK23262.1 hypothetical protein QZH56_31745 [Streptomyces olivoreticuli]
MDDDAMNLGEARYESVISVDARGSGTYDDVDKPRMRARIYRVLEAAFTHAGVARDAVHTEDRGDGVLLSVAGRIAVTRLLGLWLVEVHENLRDENRTLRVPLGLRVGMHVGPVRHDDRGISGRAVDLACRLADSPVARRLLDAERADLVLVASESLYEDVIRGGGKFIEPARYSAARLTLKEGEVTAWFHLPGRPAPAIPDGEGSGTGDPLQAVDARMPENPGKRDAWPAEADDAANAGADDGDRFGASGARYTVHGDLSQHSDNVYQQSVHIGRITGGAERRKG